MEIAALVPSFQATSLCARAGDYTRAAQHLNEGLQNIQALQTQQFPPELAVSMGTMLHLLEQRDWVAIADVIDFEFVPLVRGVMGAQP